MAETVGTLIDKLTIVELRRWHTEEAMLNASAPVSVRHVAALRLHIIDEQRDDLAAELDQLWKDIVAGTKRPKIYRQLKMYNEAEMRQASTGEAHGDSPTASSDYDQEAVSQPAEAGSQAAPITRTPVLALRRSSH